MDELSEIVLEITGIYNKSNQVFIVELSYNKIEFFVIYTMPLPSTHFATRHLGVTSIEYASLLRTINMKIPVTRYTQTYAP